MDDQRHVPILRLRALCKDFPVGGLRRKTIRVVDQVDMDVNSGEIRGIVGESGAGKTTLVRCALRLVEPSSGSIQFDGEELTHLSAASLRTRRKEFQMVFQDPYLSLNPAMNVEQILMEPLQIHRIGDRDFRLRRIRESLDAVSLSESLLNRIPAQLSGGQQQRVGIARGLILSPRLIIADEPVSALDVSVQAQILNLMAELKKRYAHTLILISHSLGAIHYLCSHISVLYRGRVVEEAPAEAFFKEPRHPYSRTLLEATLTINAKPRTPSRSVAPADRPGPETDPGCAYHAFCRHRMAVCTHRTPQLTEVIQGEKVACFLYSQEGN